MSGSMLLINPRKRRRAAPKRRRTTAKRNPISSSRSMKARISGLSRHRRSRRRNPISAFSRIRRGRRRNPISLGGLNKNTLMGLLKDAAIGGAGAITMDVVMGQLNGFLPASLQTQKTTIGVGDAVKAALTALLGTMLNKATKGLSMKMARGALTAQVYEIMSGLVPATMTMGYMSPAAIVQGTNRVGPTRGGMLQAYQRPGGRTPLLSAYLAPGTRSPMLNRVGVMSGVQAREGVSTYR